MSASSLPIFAASSLPVLLLVGVGLLTGALVVLMWTRWGQARPLTKCAGLSLFAHVLLISYAYTTNMFSQPPGRETHGTFQVRLDDFADDEDASPDATADRDWEQIPAENADQTAESRLGEVAGPEQSALAAASEAQAAAEVQPQPAATQVARQTLPAAVEKPDATAEPDPSPPEFEPAEPAEMVVEQPETLAKSSDLPEPEGGGELADSFPSEPSARAIAPTPLPVSASNAVPRRPGDGAAVPTPLKSRVAADRLKIAQKHGGSAETEAAVAAALEWLAANQSPDGRWDADAFGAGRESKTLGHDRGGAGKNADTGITGLALLAFLGSGETHLTGTHRQTVQHGLEFILSSQADDGNLAGSAEFFAAMYCHGIATLAVSEAYAMSGDARLREGLERAVGFTVAAQHVGGGWRYKPYDAGDISQFGWQVMALKSAEMGGIAIPGETRARMVRFLRSASSGPNQGLVSYRPGDRISRTMTAEGMVCRFFLDAENRQATLDEATLYVQEELPRRDATNLYYWYYGTLAMFQRQDRHWQRWNAALQLELLSQQRLDGDRAGSWDPDPIWGNYGGRVYSTALAALCLEVYYRYLPLHDVSNSTNDGGIQPRWTELPGNPYRPR